MHRKVLLTLALILVNQQSEACDTFAIQLNIGSKHFASQSQKVEYNEQNQGAGLVCDYSDANTTLLGGFYENSYSRQTYYLARRDYIQKGRFTYGMSYGIASGYNEVENNYNGVIPAFYFDAGLKMENYTVNLMYAPTRLVAKDGADVLTATIQLPL